MTLLRVRTSFVGLAGGPYLSQQFFIAPTGGTLALANNAVSKVAAFWNAFRPHIANALTYTVTAPVDELDPSTGNLIASWASTPVSNPGSAIGTPLPLANQGLLVLDTGQFRAGRRVRGRVFVPGTYTSDEGNGIPSSTYVTALAAAGASLLTAGDPTLCVWHRPPPGGSSGIAFGVNSVIGRNQWAVLRSRRD